MKTNPTAKPESVPEAPPSRRATMILEDVPAEHLENAERLASFESAHGVRFVSAWRHPLGSYNVEVVPLTNQTSQGSSHPTLASEL